MVDKKKVSFLNIGNETYAFEDDQARTDIYNAQNDINEIQGDVSNLQSDVSDLQSDVSNLQSDVSDINTELTKKADADDVEQALEGKSDVGHTHPISDVTDLQTSLDGKVPTTRTVNGKALSSNISLSAADVGAATLAQIGVTLVSYQEIQARDTAPIPTLSSFSIGELRFLKCVTNYGDTVRLPNDGGTYYIYSEKETYDGAEHGGMGTANGNAYISVTESNFIYRKA